MKNIVILSTIFILILSGCSSKKYFEPEETQSYDGKSFSMDSAIQTFNRSGATLKNSHYISKEGVSTKALPKGFELVNYSNNNLIATNNIDKILLNEEIIDIGDVVVAATLENNILAIIFSNNAIAVYDTTKKEIVFKEYLEESIENDIRITNPLFLDNLILFPTLDGKVIIVNKTDFKIVKTIVVDPDSEFNNIIYLKAVGDRLVAATDNKIIIIGSGALNLKEYDIRDVLATNENIYITTVDGRVVKFDLNLNELASKKYKFAKFYAIAHKDALYVLESQGFLIKIDNEFDKDIVYDFSFSEEAKVISLDNKIYIDDEYLEFE